MEVQVMPIPQHACWMTRKILEARMVWNNCQLMNQQSITRDLYLRLIGDGIRVPWKCLMFSTTAQPKAVFIMWLQLHAKLLTKDRLLKWGSKVEPQCMLCQNEDETRDHLFMKCSYTRRLWDEIARWMQMSSDIGGNWQQHLTWALKNAKGKTIRAQIFRMVYAEAVYAVWIERNQRVFE
ncbi:uncharacterized protein [Solanum tuberosum]|uniref:uncharacterized protein n=1 Tax=Solanum tuberosum TaxID=4113 RepID=UPI00073A2205|nr:PREDICTED: uncharacterized protein LOC107058687 [Solanum tuberosum]